MKSRPKEIIWSRNATKLRLWSERFLPNFGIMSGGENVPTNDQNLRFGIWAEKPCTGGDALTTTKTKPTHERKVGRRERVTGNRHSRGTG
jgi:hypothetical protein